ncbi:uncharacterized protein MJAP1_001114 [Malassezia japonica]|uniref:Uncharacterized protein n=1 Tax=Malassezia japonica TaxID=223818 RepID=A0AAF0EWB8_9BASI|nr:uncharacterized protein MJAP1_001114 [Malassezia japonica]WFD38166.1 hypothetical protein MJAP1_001114 [Malassezia japonica]
MAVLNSVLEAIVTVLCLLETHRALVHAPTPRRARTRVAHDWGRSDVRTERGEVRRVGSLQRRARIAEALCTLGVWSAYLCVRPLITGVLAWFIPFCSTIQMVWLLWMLANHRSASYLLFAHGIRPVLRRHEAWVDSATLWVHGLLLFLARVAGLVVQKSTPECVKRGLQRGTEWGATVYAYVQGAWQRQSEQGQAPITPKRAKTQSKGAPTPGQGKTPKVPGLPSARRVRASESVSLDSPRPTPRTKRSLRQASPTQEHRLGESLRDRAPSPPRKRRTRRADPVEPVAEPEHEPPPADHSEPKDALKRPHASEPPSDTPLSTQPKRARRSTQSARRVAASPSDAPRPLETRRPSTRAQTSRRTLSQTSLLPRPMRPSTDGTSDLPAPRRSTRVEAAHSDTPVPHTSRRAP